MVIESVAPSRVDLAGGTLDIHPLYLFEEGGVTVNAAITVQSKVRLTTNGDGHVRLASLDSGMVEEAESIDALALGGPMDLIARLVRFYRPEVGVTIETHNDAPHGSGLGASSSLLIATTGALLKLNGNALDPMTMIGYSADLEAQNVRVPTGRQDYYPACFGGINAISFDVKGDVLERLDVGEGFLREFEDRLVLSFTGECRFSGTSNWNMLKMYIDDLGTTRANMRAIKATAVAMREAFIDHDLDRFGELLGEEWANRCRLAEGVTNECIERLMAAAREAGALTGRVCGAGGGGCMTTFTAPGRRPTVEAALEAAGATVIPYKIAREGLQVRVMEP
jgi:D-glycero-alpha-D-manno-heptose-7-phosphate kinase